jgi:alanine racemase
MVSKNWCNVGDMFDHRVRISIDQKQLDLNVSTIVQNLPVSKLIPVVKANAYGHGSDIICPLLDHYGFPYFAFAALSECHTISQLGLKTPLFLLSEPGFLDCPLDYTYTVYSDSFASYLNQLGQRQSRAYQIHIKVDIGMNRLGVPFENASEFILSLQTKYPYLKCVGIFAHMPCSEDISNLINQVHIDRFNGLIERLPESFKQLCHFHLFNSGGVTYFGAQAHSLVRVGGDLYRDVMSVSSYIIALKKVNRGEGVGYDFKYRPLENTTIAIIACGYADGYSSLLGNKASVLIAGKRYPVVGKICMDMFFVDLGDDTRVSIGDEVILIGKSGNEKITNYDLSQWSSLNYREITCGIGNGLRTVKTVR